MGSLPEEIPIFPLSRVILLPRVQLPLNVFEPRYLAMVDAALASHRMIGIVQPQENGDIFSTGCAGRIVSFDETDDGRYLITLKGVCRFRTLRENPLSDGGFRTVTADWADFSGDLREELANDICRETVLGRLREYFSIQGMSCDQWEKMRAMDCEKLISTLSVVCPFSTGEKQALLEARDLKQRADMLLAVMKLCGGSDDEGGKTCH